MNDFTSPVDTDAPDAGGDVTRLLHHWTNGDPRALDRVLPMVYAELRRLAARHLRQERDGHTLAPAGLVNEAYLRLSDCEALQFQSRAQFFGLLSRLMRHVLVDHARARQAGKRGAALVSLDDLGDDGLAGRDGPASGSGLDTLALDQALRRLQQLDAQQCAVVELRFFGGLSVEETAQCLGISEATVKREWACARAWLLREMSTR